MTLPAGLREVAVILGLSVVALAVRLPFFFPAVIDWDESTFIIVGQSVADGFWPYEVAWDVKPPLLFVWYAAAIEIFGRSIESIRFAGTAWIVAAAYVVYRTSLSLSRSTLGAVVAAAICIVAVTAQAKNVASEHVAMLPMALAVFALRANRRGLAEILACGTMLGLAVMLRLNLAYLCVVVGAFLCLQGPWESARAFAGTAFARGVCFSAGVLTPTLLSALAYALTGRAEAWLAVYESAMSYSTEQRAFANIASLFREFFTFGDGGASAIANLAVAAALWLPALYGSAVLATRWRTIESESRSLFTTCLVFLFGALLSVVMTGIVYRHYLIQVVPMLAPFCALAFVASKRKSIWTPTNALWAACLAGLLVVAAVKTSSHEWRKLAQRAEAGQPLAYGAAYRIAELVRQKGPADPLVFMLDDQIVYWLLGIYPPTLLATHPSAMSKPFVRRYIEPGSSSMADSVVNILRLRPHYIVKRRTIWWLNGDPAAVRLLDKELAENYTLIETIESLEVFMRKAP